MDNQRAACTATTRVEGFGGICNDGTIACERVGKHTDHYNGSHCRTGHSWTPTTSADRLADALKREGDRESSIQFSRNRYWLPISERLIDEGFRPPAPVIKTVQAPDLYGIDTSVLDALPMHTVILCGINVYQGIGAGWWNIPGHDNPCHSETVIEVADGADIIILHQPENGATE